MSVTISKKYLSSGISSGDCQATWVPALIRGGRLDLQRWSTRLAEVVDQTCMCMLCVFLNTIHAEFVSEKNQHTADPIKGGCNFGLRCTLSVCGGCQQGWRRGGSKKNCPSSALAAPRRSNEASSVDVVVWCWRARGRFNTMLACGSQYTQQTPLLLEDTEMKLGMRSWKCIFCVKVTLRLTGSIFRHASS